MKQQIEQQLGEESLRILSLMPKWTPGNQFGHPVNIKYCVPVPFLATEEERQIFLAQRQNEEYLQDNILGLNIVPTNLETSHTIRITTTLDTLSEAYMLQHPELLTQRRRIEGYVTSDDGKPLADAWVSLSKYEQGTATDNTGHFIFWIPRTGKTLTIYSDGYETISDLQPSDTVLTIRMKPLENPIKTKEKGAIMIRGAIPQS